MKKIVFIAIILALILGGYALVQYRKLPLSPAGNSDVNNNTDQPTTPGNNTNPGTGQPPATGNSLDLSGQNLKSVPKYVFDMKNLESLNLSNNQLTGALPGEIRFLQNLKILDASNNQMTGVPAEVGQLTKLEVLNLANNQLTGLPYELGNLKNLKTLNLSGNSYSEYDLSIIRPNLPANVNIIK